MDKKEEKKFKLTKDNATAEFNRICEEFNFNISTEVKKSIVTMNLNGIDMRSDSEFIQADSFIQKIMQGLIRFDDEAKQIVYTPRNPIKTEAGNISEFRFGKFTRSMQKATKVELNRCNFATMKDAEQDSVIMAMTGLCDDAVLGNLSVAEFNDLRMIAGYFFN